MLEKDISKGEKPDKIKIAENAKKTNADALKLPFKPDRIERSARKTISLIIGSNGELIAKIPNRLTLKELNRFIEKNSVWIARNRKKKLCEIERFEAVLALRKVMLGGELLDVVLSENTRNTKIDGTTLLIPLNKFKAVNSLEEFQKKLSGIIERFLKTVGKEVLTEAVYSVLEKINRPITALKFINGKSKWGSCTRLGVMSINWRAIMLPESLIEYIATHEAMHLIELNHSPSFWACVNEHIPDYKKRRLELKNYSILQQTFRK